MPIPVLSHCDILLPALNSALVQHACHTVSNCMPPSSALPMSSSPCFWCYPSPPLHVWPSCWLITCAVSMQACLMYSSALGLLTCCLPSLPPHQVTIPFSCCPILLPKPPSFRSACHPVHYCCSIAAFGWVPLSLAVVLACVLMLRSLLCLTPCPCMPEPHIALSNLSLLSLSVCMVRFYCMSLVGTAVVEVVYSIFILFLQNVIFYVSHLHVTHQVDWPAQESQNTHEWIR